jgi:hypothetical protein
MNFKFLEISMLKLKKSFAVLTALVCLIAFGAKDGFAAKGSIKGSLPRDLSTGVFTITVTISDITQDQQNKGELEPSGDAVRLAARIKLYLNDNSTALPFVEDTTGAAKFFVRESSPMVPVQEGVLWKHTYTLEILQTTSNALATEAGNGTVKSVNVKFSYNLGGAENEILPQTSNFSIVQDSYVINKAPEFESTALFGSHRSLTINWKVENEVDALAGTTATKKKPAKMLVFLVDSELVTSADDLSASKYSASSTADTPTTCQLNLTSADAQDCITCADGVYLNEAKREGITYRLENATDGKATFVNLENKRRYFAILQYEPDGVKRSQCVVGIPTANNSMTELNGAGDATVVDFRCFIATAAYGSQAHEELKYFRKFRDEVLLQTSLGKELVDFYYRVSPPAAEFIAANPTLRNVVQSALYVPLQLLKLADPWY